MVDNAIRIMCRSPKFRAGCHFPGAQYAPAILGWSLDQHTIASRKLGHGLDHFRKQGAKLIPGPTEPDLVHRGSLPAVGAKAAEQVVTR